MGRVCGDGRWMELAQEGSDFRCGKRSVTWFGPEQPARWGKLMGTLSRGHRRVATGFTADGPAFKSR
jgi:hypothetical protein